MNPIIHLILNIVHIYQFCIVVRCILSFLNPYSPVHRNPAVRYLYKITDPLLDAVRNAFPFLAQGGFDLSPIALIFLIQITVRIILNLFQQ